MYKVIIEGPPGSPFVGGWFKVEIIQPDDYDPRPPQVIFKTLIYHPNFDNEGKIYYSALKPHNSLTFFL